MKFRSIRALCFLSIFNILLFAACGESPDHLSESSDSEFRTISQSSSHDRYIVMFNDGVPSELASKSVAANARVQRGHVYRHVFSGFSFRGSSTAAAQIANDPRVRLVEPDGRANLVAQMLPTGVNRIDAELNATASIDGIDSQLDAGIAILDTGIDLSHADLNVTTGVDCLSTMGCITGSGYGQDDHGHGTHVAGSAAARDNDFGVVGVAPGARLYAVKVLDQYGSGWWSTIAAGLDWASAHASEIDVVNMSLAGRTCSDTLQTAIESTVDLGIIVTAAAGNEAAEISGDGVFGNCDDAIPASYAEVATISALADSDGVPGGNGTSTYAGSDDSFAGFSNYSSGTPKSNPVNSPGGGIDLMLPGVDIVSTCLGGGYCVMSGTSMASPHAAGLAALYVLENGRPTGASGVHAVRQALIDQGWSQTSSDGLALQNDPDANLESLGRAVSSETSTTLAVEISPQNQSKSGAPGTDVTYDFTVCNNGNATDSYDMTASSGWPSSVTPSSLTDLAPSNCATVTVTDNIAFDAVDGESYTGTLYAISTTSSSVQDTAFFSTTASVDSTTEPTYGVDVTSSFQSSSGAPGDDVSYDYTVCNTGSGSDSFTLSTSAVWVSSVSPGSLSSLAAGSCVAVTVTHSIPTDALDADVDFGSLYADSDASSESAEANFETTAVVSEPALEPLDVDGITPNSVSAGDSVQVTVSGSGFQQGADLALETSQGPVPGVSKVIVEDSTTITAVVSTKTRGPRGSRLFDVRVTNPDGTSDVLSRAFEIIR